MARHFGPQHIKNGYAAMGQSRRRPLYSGFNSQRTVAEAIAAARHAAAKQAARAKK
jgi:hypothetical protein